MIEWHQDWREHQLRRNEEDYLRGHSIYIEAGRWRGGGRPGTGKPLVGMTGMAVVLETIQNNGMQLSKSSRDYLTQRKREEKAKNE